MTVCHTVQQMRVLYAAPAANCVRRLRVLPPHERGSQRVLDAQWHCTPPPDSWREVSDDFGNHVLELRHRRIDAEFRFQMKLSTTRREQGAGHDEGLPPSGIGAFLLPSALCDLNRNISDAAQRLHCGAEDAATNATRVCEWTHAALTYSLVASDARTTASQALQRGAGACQDYAHLMIAVCRALALPARYVSGYNPAEGLMHAWVEVLCGDHWIAWDPTHNRRTAPNCVFAACGRDFRDVAPASGRYQGKGRARLEFWCRTGVET